MSRSRTGGRSGVSPAAQATAASLLNSGALPHCLNLLRSLLDYWKAHPASSEDVTPPPPPSRVPSPTSLLKQHPPPPPDMSPFFLKQYVKGHATDVFQAYPQLLTEMVLRLPYQIKKVCDSVPSLPSPTLEQAWYFYLCESMLTKQTPYVRRQVRKLLLYICGNKDRYRQLRDMHTLESHIKDVKVLCAVGGFDFSSQTLIPLSLPYDSLLSLMEHLRACVDIATARTSNWQRFLGKDESVLPFLVQAALCLDEGVRPTLLQLLQCAISGAAAVQEVRKIFLWLNFCVIFSTASR